MITPFSINCLTNICLQNKQKTCPVKVSIPLAFYRNRKLREATFITPLLLCDPVIYKTARHIPTILVPTVLEFICEWRAPMCGRTTIVDEQLICAYETRECQANAQPNTNRELINTERKLGVICIIVLLTLPSWFVWILIARWNSRQCQTLGHSKTCYSEIPNWTQTGARPGAK